MAKIKLIVGLGNPGMKYQNTRHNVGAWLVNHLAYKLGVSLKEEPKFFGYTARVQLANTDVRLLIPTTFMNLSGKAVAALATFYRIMPDEILIVHDELDLPPGQAKLKFAGGHGGHNGLKDIISKLANHNDFYRLRIGIGHPGDKNKVVDYVLNKPDNQDLELIEQSILVAIGSINTFITSGLEAAMQQLHSNKIN